MSSLSQKATLLQQKLGDAESAIQERDQLSCFVPLMEISGRVEEKVNLRKD